MPNFEPLRPAPSPEATWPWGGSDLSNLRYFKSQLPKWQRMSNACHFHNEMHKTSSAFFVDTPALPFFDVVVLPNTWLHRVVTGTPHSFDACKIRTPFSTARIVPWRSEWSNPLAHEVPRPKQTQNRIGFILMLDTACRMLNRSSKTQNSLLCHHCNGPNCKSECQC